MPKLARWLASAVLLAALVAATSAQAATTYTVNTTADNPTTPGECSGAAGDCSLRQALDKAASGDTVAVPASASPYSVTDGLITVPGGVTLQGAGASSTTISGGGTSQLLSIDPSGPVTIRSLTLAQGTTTGSFSESGSIQGDYGDLTLDGVTIRDGQTDGGYGGAMEIGGHVTISNSRFTHNSASTFGFGGAIDLLGGSTLTVSNSVFENNFHSDSSGGAIYAEANSTLTITSTTFSGNSAGTGSSAGAVGLDTGGHGTIENSTFTGNSAPTSGGAVYFHGATLSLLNDTFSGNSSPVGANLDDAAGATTAQNTIFAAPGGGGTSCSAPLTTTGHDLDDSGGNSCLLSSSQGDLVGVNPALGALADNSSQVPTAGGPPQTMALPDTSPAVGAGDATACGTVGDVDERGFPRPGIPGAGCDIGAYEGLPQVGTSTSASASTGGVMFHQPVTITATIAAGRALPPAVLSPSGTVTFTDGSTVLGSTPVSSSHASITTSTLAVGAHVITATYSGDGIYGGSASAAVTVTVSAPKPSISRLRESHKKWRLGSKHARLSKRGTPVGTVFRFDLDTNSTLQLTFRRIVGHKKRPAGTLTFKNAKAGQRKLAFQGRLKGHRKLKPGRYTMTLTASNTTGHSSRTLKFTIVR